MMEGRIMNMSTRLVGVLIPMLLSLSLGVQLRAEPQELVVLVSYPSDPYQATLLQQTLYEIQVTIPQVMFQVIYVEQSKARGIFSQLVVAGSQLDVAILPLVSDGTSDIALFAHEGWLLPLDEFIDMETEAIIPCITCSKRVYGLEAVIPYMVVVVPTTTHNGELSANIAKRLAAKRLPPDADRRLREELAKELDELAQKIAGKLGESSIREAIAREMREELELGNQEAILSDDHFAEFLEVQQEVVQIKEKLTRLRILPVLDLYLPFDEHRERWLESWDENLLVASDPLTREEEHTYIKAYDVHGNFTWLSPEEPPQIPVFVLTPCEHKTHYYPLPEYWGAHAGHPAAVSVASPEDPPDIVLTLLRVTNWAAMQNIESWWKGDPELYLWLIASNGGTMIRQWFLGYKRGWTGAWAEYNRFLFQWDPAVWTNNVLFYWFEQDAGATLNVGVTAQNVTAVIQIYDGDDDGGSVLVPSTFLSPSTYSTGIIDWSLTRK
jgi:hypothetical protein